MTLQSRFEAALAIIAEHNAALAAGRDSLTLVAPGTIDAEKFETRLKAMGGTTEDRLKGLSYEDILECLPAYDGVKPKLLAKEIAKAFRGKEEVVTATEKRPVSSKTAERMTIRELVEAFDADNSTNAIGSQLARIAKGQAFIVYSSGRTVDVESTLKLLQEIKKGFSGRDDFNVNGVPVQVYKLGEVPDNFADENPLWENRPLRPDGTCDQMGRSWEGVELSVRQLIKIAVEQGEIKVSIDTAHDVLDMALSAEAMTKLRSRYRKSSLEFDRLAKTNQLPTLTLTLGSPKSNSGGSLKDGKKVVWAAPVIPTWNNMQVAKGNSLDQWVGAVSNSYYKAQR